MEENVIKKFLEPGYGSGYGYGYGDGYGYGYGYGDGYGYGYGDGSGDGSGYGYGYGYGDGSGYGYGDGSGDGSGYGYGDGDGSGYGYGDGYKGLSGDAIHYIDGVPTIIQSVHGSVARGKILQGDLTLLPCYVVKGGGFFAHGETLQDAQEALEEKILDHLPVEEKIEEFCKKFKPNAAYTAREFYAWHHFLTGSCEMGRQNFAQEHGIDLDQDSMTPEEFMDLTKDAYGAGVIRRLMEVWKKLNKSTDCE